MERLSVSEAAERLGVSASTVRRRLRAGELDGEREPGKKGRLWVLLPADAADEPGEVDAAPAPLPFVPPTPRSEDAGQPPLITDWPSPASRPPISLAAERAARRGFAAERPLGFAWAARDRRSYRWLAAGTEASPSFGDLAGAARYGDRDQALTAIRISRTDAEPVQVFVELDGERGVA